MQQRTAVEVMGEIEEAAKGHENAPRFVRTMACGEYARQGDVYVSHAGAAVKRGAVRGSRQVALGTSTGSRHVAEGDGVVVYERPGAGTLDGPIVVAPERWTLTHPEHAHVSFPAGTYEVSYQQDFASQRAVQD